MTESEEDPSSLSELDVRRLRCIDGLHYSFQLLALSFEPMWGLCCDIPADNGKVARALSCCWTFIDSLHRIREIAQCVPGLGSKHPEMRAFLSTTEAAEDCRHYIQHLRGELSKRPPDPSPVWGSLSWVDRDDPLACHTAMLGAQIPGTQFTSCVFDSYEGRWVSRVCLAVSGRPFHFDLMAAAAERFKEFVMPLLLERASERVAFHDKLPITTLRIAFPDQEDFEVAGKISALEARDTVNDTGA